MSENKSITTTDSEVETNEFHKRYLRAENNPLRRKILDVLKVASATIDELANNTRLDTTALRGISQFSKMVSILKKRLYKGN